MATKKTVQTRPNFLYTDEAVSQLARQYVDGADTVASVNESYLKVLVAHAQRELKAAKTISQEAMIGAATAAHERLYGIVLATVVTPEIQVEDGLEPEDRARRAKERNRRSNFARSAKSVLVNWLRAGNKLTGLDPAAANKEQMQRDYRREPSFEVRLEAAENRLVQLMRELTEQDPEAARDRLGEIETALAQVVTPPKPLTTSTRRVRDITLHPH